MPAVRLGWPMLPATSSQAVPAVMSQVHRRHMRTRLECPLKHYPSWSYPQGWGEGTQDFKWRGWSNGGKLIKKREKPYGFQQNPENSWTKPEPQNIPCRISEPLTSLVVLIRRTTRPRYAGNATNPQIVLNTPKKSHSTQATKKNTWQLFLPKKIPESKIANPQKTSIIPVTWDPEYPPGILPRFPLSLSLSVYICHQSG